MTRVYLRCAAASIALFFASTLSASTLTFDFHDGAQGWVPFNQADWSSEGYLLVNQRWTYGPNAGFETNEGAAYNSPGSIFTSADYGNTISFDAMYSSAVTGTASVTPVRLIVGLCDGWGTCAAPANLWDVPVTADMWSRYSVTLDAAGLSWDADSVRKFLPNVRQVEIGFDYMARFGAQGGTTQVGMGLDNIVIQGSAVVPEPASVLLLLTAVPVLCARRRISTIT